LNSEFPVAAFYAIVRTLNGKFCREQAGGTRIRNSERENGMNKISSLGIVVAAGLFAVSQYGCGKAPQLGKDPIKDVVAAMTLEEKAYFVTGTGVDMASPGSQSAEKRPAGAPVVGATQKLVPGAAGTTYAIDRLGIPAMVLADGPAGLRITPVRENDSSTYYCTAFPVSTLLASTWDPDLAYKVGQAMGNEVLEYGVDVLLGPAMNIHRNPLCGRNFEYYSEDPLITGKIAAAVVNGIESQGVGTSIKHFAANNTETNRNALNTIMSERTLREIYLEGYRIVIDEAQPWTVMSSYNLINGVPASQSHDLLTKILREDWGFHGFVMTDWFGGTDAVAQVLAGNDLLMPGTVAQANAIIGGVREGKLDVAKLDRNIERILNVLVQTPRFKGHKPSNKPDMKAHAAVARRTAAEGMVLLKNSDSALPLAAGKRLAAFGITSYDIITGGTGSGDVNEAYRVSLVDGLKNAGYSVHDQLRSRYVGFLRTAKEKRPKTQAFMPPVPIEEMPVERALASKIASDTDVALITIGRNSGEFFDRKIEGDFNLTKTETDLITVVSNVFHAQGKKVIVVLNIGGVIETESWKKLPDSILLAWQGGQESGNAIADVMSGKVNPSGKLASTFPVRYGDVPSSKNFPGIILGGSQASASDQADGMSAFNNPKPSRITYEEGIYVGYRYYETFGVKPSYEFGYGLSYTSFDYGNLSLGNPASGGEITASLDVQNTGKATGSEIVQVYVSAPFRKLEKPAAELKAFAKTRPLKPGESQTLSFTLKPRQLASFDPASSSWIAEAGKYDIRVGGSSRDIRQTAGFTLEKDIVVKRESTALVPEAIINELKPRAGRK
jgi:beta-glucosidase